MNKNTLNNELPTEEEFKNSAWKLKEEQEIKLSAALNELSLKYGYKSFNAIKPFLSQRKHQFKIITPDLSKSNSSKDIEKEEETIFRNYIDNLITNNEEKKIKIIELNIPGFSTRKIKKYFNKYYDYLAFKKYTFEEFEEIDDKIYLMYHEYTFISRLKNGNYLVNGVELINNNEYIIIPDNPKKLKHRNRKCTLIAIEKDSMPRTAEVKFLDTKRVGIVELIDLKNI
jgi:hypothetical protein